MTKKAPKPRTFKPGEIVEYHGRKVEILEVGTAQAPSGGTVELVRVKDPARGRRGMFRWQLEEGLGAKPEKALVPDRDEAAYR